MKKFVWLVLLAAFTCLLFFLWLARDGGGGRHRVALVMKTLNNPFFVDMERGAREAAARHPEIELIVQATQQDIDVERQIQIVENLIVEGVDVICVTPNESSGILPSIKKANEAGIPVIVVDTRINHELAEKMGIKTLCFIGSDNYLGGRIAARYIAGRLNGKGKVAILEGVPGQETADSRRRGFLDELKNHPEVMVVASQPADWERLKGYHVCQNILQANPDVDYIFGCNDEMALGAVEAVDAAGKIGEVGVVGFDCTSDARRAIREGRMDGSVAQYPYQMGMLSVETAVDFISGGKIPQAEIPTKVEMIIKGSSLEILPF